MFSIPASFTNEAESYITIPPMKQFMRDNSVAERISTLDRPEMLEANVEYGKASEDNAERVLVWLDKTIKEGTKDVYLYSFDIDSDMLSVLQEEQTVIRALGVSLDKARHQHLVGPHYTP